jgi:hypothetical protein
MGRVAAVLNHGAGDILELRGAGLEKPLLVPFTGPWSRPSISGRARSLSTRPKACSTSLSLLSKYPPPEARCADPTGVARQKHCAAGAPSDQLLSRHPVRKIHAITAMQAISEPADRQHRPPQRHIRQPEERPAEARDQVDHRVEQADRLPGGRQHRDRVESAAQKHERRDGKQRHQLQLLEILRPDADDEAEQR